MRDFNAEAQRRRGWEVRRSKYIWREVINLSKDGSEQLLSVSQYDGVRPASEASRSESLKGYKIVEKGDLVINIMLAWMGGLGVSEYDGIVSPAYAVYKLIAPMEPRFLHYLYRTRRYLADFARHSTGVVPSRWRMYSDDFGQVVTEFPPLPEQKAIVAYLDAETGRIDKAIAAEEKMIALLQERREIVINEAVGGGENLNAEAQRGRGRRGWEIVQLKRVAKICTGSTPDKNRQDYYTTSSGTLWIKPENLDSSVAIQETTEYLTEKGVLQGRIFPAHSVFVCCIASVGKVGFSDKEASCNQQINALIFNDKVYWKFGYYATVAAKEQYVAMASGNVVKILNTAAQGKINFPLPPLPEQKAIVERLDRETGEIDRAIEVKWRQIELLRERRQIVIDEAVTGARPCKANGSA